MKKNSLSAILLSSFILLANIPTAYAADIQNGSGTIKKEEVVSQNKNTETKQNKENASNTSNKNKVTSIWSDNQSRMDYPALLENIKERKVSAIIFSENIYEFNNVKVQLTNGDKFVSPIISRVNFEKIVEDANIPATIVPNFESLNKKQLSEEKSPMKRYANTAWYYFLLGASGFGLLMLGVLKTLFVMILVYATLYWIYTKIKNKGNNEKISPEDIDTSFEDIAGHHSAKKDILETISFFKDDSKFKEMGVSMPNGILLNGPPGNGKTMFAKAIAKECGADFYSTNGSEFEEVFAGLGAKRVRDLFKTARKSNKAVIFIDEIDSVAKKRGGMHNYHEQTLNQLLTEMDGFSKRSDSKILVIAATNRVDVLDEAILRPGRFDRILLIPKPTKKDRVEMIKVYINKAVSKSGEKLVIGEDLDWESMASLTIGMSGAEIKNLIDEVLMLLIRKESYILDKHIFREAKDKILLGNPRTDLILRDVERKTVAYHEVAHAFAAYIASESRTVEGITIIPHEKALGVTYQTEKYDSVLRTKKSMIDDIVVLVAGRAAEEIFMKGVTNGASNDLERANILAYEMFLVYGMSDTLPLINASQYAERLSEKTKYTIEKNISALLSQEYERIKAFISENIDFFEHTVDILLQQDHIDKGEFEEIAEKFDLDMVREEYNAIADKSRTL